VVGRDRGSFELGSDWGFDGEAAGLGDRDRGAIGGVGAAANGDLDRGLLGVGVLPAGEGLDMAGAVLVAVVDDPSFLSLPVGGDPAPFADRHGNPPFVTCARIM